MSLLEVNDRLIEAPHLGVYGVLEVNFLWQDSDVTAVLFHPNPVDGGNMRHKVISTLYRYARDKGYNVLCYNSRGVGKSSGTPTASDLEFEDALCVLDWLEKNTDIKTLWLGGFSFGGYMACMMADYLMSQGSRAVFGIKALALIAPSIEKHDVRTLSVPWYKAFLVYGDEDKLVSPTALAEFSSLYGLKTHVFSETGHFFHGKLVELKAVIETLDVY